MVNSRRLLELLTGYAFAQVWAVRQELSSPTCSTEEERRLLRAPRGYVAPILTATVSSVGIFFLARCLGNALLGQAFDSGESKRFGAMVAFPFFASLSLSTGYVRYADVLEEVMCPEHDTAFAATLRNCGMPWAPEKTALFLKNCERRCLLQVRFEQGLFGEPCDDSSVPASADAGCSTADPWSDPFAPQGTE
eukprot:NODE_18617_length_884_cov_4.836196.p1 GENE.NODE_18617_length_884_cov_4.836196~~NODE_18617_length_884_cov_4.836196.p1  ORF type:complete len:193 (+),score=41.95 NODE_18617_length_884_cov_4.836196:230-808(+)